MADRDPPDGCVKLNLDHSAALALLALPCRARAVVGEFNGERIVGRTWPAAENRVVVLELTY